MSVSNVLIVCTAQAGRGPMVACMPAKAVPGSTVRSALAQARIAYCADSHAMEAFEDVHLHGISTRREMVA